MQSQEARRKDADEEESEKKPRKDDDEKNQKRNQGKSIISFPLFKVYRVTLHSCITGFSTDTNCFLFSTCKS